MVFATLRRHSSALSTKFFLAFQMEVNTYTYIDDLLIASSTDDEHKHHLRAVFQHLDKYGIVINPLKCMFEVKELTFLGYNVSSS